MGVEICDRKGHIAGSGMLAAFHVLIWVVVEQVFAL